MDPNVFQQMAFSLEHFNDTNDQIRDQSIQFLMKFRETQPTAFMQLLMAHISDFDQYNVIGQSVACIFLFKMIHYETSEQQRKFNSDWAQIPIEVRDKLRVGLTKGVVSPNPHARQQAATVLGQFFSMEYPTGNFAPQFNEILQQAGINPEPEIRKAIHTVFSYFSSGSFDVNPKCGSDIHIYYQLALNVFQLLLAQMNDLSNADLQKSAMETFSNSIFIFERVISFEGHRNALFETLFHFLTSGNQLLWNEGYNAARKIVDYFYTFLSYGSNNQAIPLIAIAQQDLVGADQERQIKACALLQTIGDVESDLQLDDVKAKKPRHRQFGSSVGLSLIVLEKCFSPLVQLICTCNNPEIETTDTNNQPYISAFACLSTLAKAADAPALNPIFSFVQANASNPGWNFRYAAVLLLNSASKLISFTTLSQNILTAYDLFIQFLSDQVPRILDAAMWSLGKLIEDVPDLVVNTERFNALVAKIPTILQRGSDLASRCCWLLKYCFSAFQGRNDGSEQILTENFESFSDLLLTAAQSDDITTLDAAYGALNSLVENAPSNITDKYALLFQQITQRLGALLTKIQGKTFQTNSVDSAHATWICFLLQTIVIYVGNLDESTSKPLMQMLMALIQVSNGQLLAEILPAIGAVARSTGEQFRPYVQPLVQIVVQQIDSRVDVQPACVLIGDIYTAIQMPLDITKVFVSKLFGLFDLYECQNIREMRNAILSVLGIIAEHIGMNSMEWIDQFLLKIEQETKIVTEEREEAVDLETVKSLHITILQIFKGLVPILAEVPNGFRKVRSFFYIFDQIKTYSSNDPQVLYNAVQLIGLIIEKMGRKLNVVLNKPVVGHVLEAATKAGNEQLSEFAEEVMQRIKDC